MVAQAHPTRTRGRTLPRRENVIPAISVSGLVKNFGATRALDHLDLKVRSGGGARLPWGRTVPAKTTTVRVLLGLLRRDAGEATVLGGDPWRDVVTLHRRLAYVPGEVNLWPNLTGGEVIDLLGRLARRLDPERRARCWNSSSSTRPRSAAPAQGQPAEGGARGGVRLRRRAVPLGRAELRSRPVDGGGLPGGRPRVAECGPNRAVEPHPRRGRGAVRSRHDHPRRPSRRDGNVRRAAPPTRTTVVVETAEPIGTLSDLPGVHDVSIDHARVRSSVSHQGAQSHPGAPRRARRALADQLAAHARRALHAPLRRGHRDPRRRRAGECAMKGLRGTMALTGLALTRDRFKLPAYVLGPAS